MENNANLREESLGEQTKTGPAVLGMQGHHVMCSKGSGPRSECHICKSFDQVGAPEEAPSPAPADEQSPDEIKAMARAQFIEAKGPTKVTCPCGRSIPIRFAYKCLYCDIFRCMCCAEDHFGKTRKQYNAEKLAPMEAPQSKPMEAQAPPASLTEADWRDARSKATAYLLDSGDEIDAALLEIINGGTEDYRKLWIANLKRDLSPDNSQEGKPEHE